MDANPFITDHVIGGNPVLPTVCATGWMATASEEIYSGYHFFCLDNYRLFKGISFDGSEPDAVNLEIKRQQLDEQQIQLHVVVWSTNLKGLRVNHYGAELTLLKQLPAAPTYKAFDSTFGSTFGSTQAHSDGQAELYSNGTLFHGERFQGIRRVMNYSASKLTLLCRAADVAVAEQGQFPVAATNPYVDDLLYQSMLVWARYHYGSGSLPSAAKRCEQYRLVPSGSEFYLSLDVLSSNSAKLVADIVLHDAAGLIYSKMFGAEVTISNQLNNLFLRVKS